MAENRLTPGELRAFKTYMELETHENAAHALNISTQTLKNHLGAVYKKLGRRKAHSALYKLCLDQGFDPLASADPQPETGGFIAPLTDSHLVGDNEPDEAAS